MKPLLSVVCPVYNEAESIPHLVEELYQVLSGLQDRIRGFEVIFVDDGSTDQTPEVLRRAREERHHLGVIRFRTNVGKSAALARGFRAAAGDVVVTIDGDLQDDPHEIPLLLDKIQEGYHVVSGWKAKRQDPLTKRLPSKLFNWATRVASGLPLHDFNCGLKAYRSEVVREINVYGQLHRFLPVLAHWRGFKITEVKVNHRPRRYGRSKFGASRFVTGLLDFITVVFLMKYRRRPSHLFGLLGVILFTLGILINLYLVLVWLRTHAIGGRPLLMFGVLATILGIQFVSIGLLGEMMVYLTKSDEDVPVEMKLAPRGDHQ